MMELTKAMIQPDCCTVSGDLSMFTSATHNANADCAQPEWVAGNVTKIEPLRGIATAIAHFHLL